MPLTFTFPQTSFEALTMLVPLLTVLLGLMFLLMPKRMLLSAGLEAKPTSPDAVGEGRAAYAGILLAFGLCCLLLQEPRALQPGFNQMLAIAWGITGLGFLAQMLIEKRRAISDIARLLLAFVLSGLAWMFSDDVSFGLVVPKTSQEWVFAAIAAFTVTLGLMALFMPRLALQVMRLQLRDGHATCICGPRGLLGGFYIAAGIGLFIIKEPVVAAVWLNLLLGAVWLLTGIGRIIAMVCDPKLLRGFSVYNILGTVLKLSLGCYVVAAVFGLI